MTRALILAAGQGSRLRPLTNDKPKCLVHLLGKSLLERQTHTLKQVGIDNIQVATGYCSDQIEKLGFPISINPHFAETNMVESLFCALDFIREEGDLIIAYGDIVYQSNNLKALLDCDDEIALMIDRKWKDLWSLRLENPLDDAETLIMNCAGYITELGKKPQNYNQIEGQYTGLIKMRSDKLAELEKFYNQLDRSAFYDGKDFKNMYMTSFLQLLIDRGWKAKAVQVNNGWLEVDSLEDIRQYEKMAEDGVLDNFYKVEC
jgi:L-glutamine-phosphate cytidylyltransferase